MVATWDRLPPLEGAEERRVVAIVMKSATTRKIAGAAIKT